MKPSRIQHHTIKLFRIQYFTMNGFIWNSVYIIINTVINTLINSYINKDIERSLLEPINRSSHPMYNLSPKKQSYLPSFISLSYSFLSSLQFPPIFLAIYKKWNNIFIFSFALYNNFTTVLTLGPPFRLPPLPFPSFNPLHPKLNPIS